MIKCRVWNIHLTKICVDDNMIWQFDVRNVLFLPRAIKCRVYAIIMIVLFLIIIIVKLNINIVLAKFYYLMSFCL